MDAAIIFAILDAENVELDCRDEAGCTAAMRACRDWGDDVIQKFISSGADLLIKDHEGKNAFDYINLNRGAPLRSDSFFRIEEHERNNAFDYVNLNRYVVDDMEGVKAQLREAMDAQMRPTLK
jgi:ankyrin repeat protein